MAIFGNMSITNAGQVLYTKAQAGKPIIFTKMQLGSGQIGTQNPATLVALVQSQFDVSISSITPNTSLKTATISGTINNNDITEAIYICEMGLWAQDPDVGEILYGYASAGTLGDYMAPASQGPYSWSYQINAAVGNAANITANVSSIMYDYSLLTSDSSLSVISGGNQKEINKSIDSLLKNVTKTAHGAVADLVALKAIDTSSLPDNITIIVKSLGFYRFDSTSTLIADDNSVVQPTTGLGRWLNDLASHRADLASQDLNKGASLIGIHDANNQIIATNVEGALNELASRPQKDMDNGRYQADFGFEDMITTDSALNGNIITLDTTILNVSKVTATGNGNYANVVGATLSGARIKSGLITVNNIKTVSIYVDVQNGNGSDLELEIYDVTSSTSLGTKLISRSNIKLANYNDFIFDVAININNAHTLDFRLRTKNYTSADGYGIQAWTNNVANNYYLITTSNSWNNITESTTYGVLMNIYSELSNITGTATKTVTPSDIKKWGNLKWTQNVPVNTSVVCDVLKSDGTTILKSNVASIVDLSDIDIAANPSLKVRWTLSRNSISDVSPTVNNPSVTWEGQKSTYGEVRNSAPNNPKNGQFYYDSILNKMRFFINGAWV